MPWISNPPRRRIFRYHAMEESGLHDMQAVLAAAAESSYMAPLLTPGPGPDMGPAVRGVPVFWRTTPPC